MTSDRRLLVLTAAAVVAGGFVGLAGGDLQPSDGGSLAAWRAWCQQASPADVPMAAVRLVVLGLAGWVGLTAALQLALSSAPAAREVVDRWSPTVVRRAARGLAGAGLAVSALGVGPAAAGPPPAPATATMEPLGPVGDEPSTTPAPVTSSPHRTTTTTVPVASTPTTSSVPPSAPPPTSQPPAPSPPSRPAAGEAPGSGAEVYVVERGDSFWSIAAAHLAEGRVDPPDERSIARHWRAVMAANADRLVVPGAFDLLHPGQELVLPPVP